MRRRNSKASAALGGRLRRARKCAGYTLRVLAGEIGVTHSSISYWESGTTEPSATNLIRFCLITKVDPFWLVTGQLLSVETARAYAAAGVPAAAAIPGVIGNLLNTGGGAIGMVRDDLEKLGARAQSSLVVKRAAHPSSARPCRDGATR